MFTNARVIRQRWPLSALLFVLSVEIMASRLRNNKDFFIPFNALYFIFTVLKFSYPNSPSLILFINNPEKDLKVSISLNALLKR
jgi:hypothetical protein